MSEQDQFPSPQIAPPDPDAVDTRDLPTARRRRQAPEAQPIPKPVPKAGKKDEDWGFDDEEEGFAEWKLGLILVLSLLAGFAVVSWKKYDTIKELASEKIEKLTGSVTEVAAESEAATGDAAPPTAPDPMASESRTSGQKATEPTLATTKSPNSTYAATPAGYSDDRPFSSSNDGGASADRNGSSPTVPAGQDTSTFDLRPTAGTIGSDSPTDQWGSANSSFESVSADSRPDDRPVPADRPGQSVTANPFASPESGEDAFQMDLAQSEPIVDPFAGGAPPKTAVPGSDPFAMPAAGTAETAPTDPLQFERPAPATDDVFAEENPAPDASEPGAMGNAFDPTAPATTELEPLEPINLNRVAATPATPGPVDPQPMNLELPPVNDATFSSFDNPPPQFGSEPGFDPVVSKGGEASMDLNSDPSGFDVPSFDPPPSRGEMPELVPVRETQLDQPMAGGFGEESGPANTLDASIEAPGLPPVGSPQAGSPTIKPPASPGGDATIPQRVDVAKDTRTYLVENGETFWSISKLKYGTPRYFAALAEWNVGVVSNPNALRPGVRIELPPADVLEPLVGSATVPGNEPATGGTVRNLHPQATQDRTYKVQSGETYWSISKSQYGTVRYFGALSEWNRKTIGDPSKLKPGKTIELPAVSKLDPLIKSAAFPATIDGEAIPNSDQGTYGYFETPDGDPRYRVGPTDTLTGVAQVTLGRASRWRQIYAMNRDKLRSPDVLPKDAVLKLPPDAVQLAARP